MKDEKIIVKSTENIHILKPNNSIEFLYNKNKKCNSFTTPSSFKKKLFEENKELEPSNISPKKNNYI